MDLLIAASVSAISAGSLGYLAYQIRKKEAEFNMLSCAKEYSPSSLMNALKDTQFYPSDVPGEYWINAFVGGDTACASPITSSVNGKTKLIYSLIYRTEIRENNTVMKSLSSQLDNKRLVEINVPKSFVLRDRNSQHVCVIGKNEDVRVLAPLESLGQTQKMKIGGVIQSFVGMVGALIGAAGQSMLDMRNISIGWSESEFGIKVGGFLTVYGKLIYDAKTNTLRIDNPLYFLKNKASALIGLKESLVGHQFMITLLVIPFVLSTYYLVKRWKESYRRYRDKVERAKFEKVNYNIMDEEYKCVICFEHPRNVILKPCMHFSICRDCYESLRTRNCPVCKVPIQETMDIYFS